jgi:hypothetical protein
VRLARKGNAAVDDEQQPVRGVSHVEQARARLDLERFERVGERLALRVAERCEQCKALELSAAQGSTRSSISRSRLLD